MKNKHRPPHLYLDNTYYFITSGTFHKEPYFNTFQKKELIKKVLFHTMNAYEYTLYAWVILDNHYYLLLKTKSGTLLPRVISTIQGKSAVELNKLDNTSGKQRWYQYWDYCIRSESDFWKHFNYIHHNPVKHGYIKEQKTVAEYPFSSYNTWVEKEGEEWINSCFAQYSIVDFTKEDDF